MSNHRRIRLLFNVHPRIWGGTEAFAVRLVNHLDSRRFESHIYTSANDFAVKELAKESLNVSTPPSDSVDEIAFLRSLLTKLEIDVVQANHLNSPLALAAKSLSRPVVWRIGGHINEIMKGARSADKKRALAVVEMVADRIVSASDFLATQFADFPMTPITTIHNGVDVDSIVAQARASRPEPRKPLTVGLIGHIIPQKRHLDLLAAARIVKRQYPKTRFRFFGAPYPSERDALYLERVKEIARQSGLRSDLSIEHCKDDKFQRYAEADMMVFPGLNEGCSNAILEAMALGLPVIAADSGGNPELIEDGKTGLLVPPKSPRRLAAAILSLAGDPAMRERLGAAGQARVRVEFDISRCAARYGEIYEGLARSGVRKG